MSAMLAEYSGRVGKNLKAVNSGVSQLAAALQIYRGRWPLQNGGIEPPQDKERQKDNAEIRGEWLLRNVGVVSGTDAHGMMPG